MEASFVELGPNRGDEIRGLLQREPSFNGFIISDLESGAYAPEFVRMYGDVEGNSLMAVLFIFHDKAVYYSPEDRDVYGFIKYLNAGNVTKLVGKKAVVEKFIPFLNVRQESDSCVLEMHALPKQSDTGSLVIKQIASRQELERLHGLFMRVREYMHITADKDRFVDNQMTLIQAGTSRTLYAEVDGEMIATATSSSERPRTVILTGVATLPTHRNKGYASTVVATLCSAVIGEGKTVYLFFNNPEAGLIYKRIGFHEGGPWKVLEVSWEE